MNNVVCSVLGYLCSVAYCAGDNTVVLKHQRASELPGELIQKYMKQAFFKKNLLHVVLGPHFEEHS